MSLAAAGSTYERAFAEAYGQIAGDAVARLALPALSGLPGSLASPLPVEDVAAATVATALSTASRWRELSTGRLADPSLDRGHVAAAFHSEVHVRLDGEPIDGGFAPLSRFWRVADGWVRTHGNYAWHRDALLTALDIADGASDPESVGAVLADLGADDIEQRVTAAGGIAVAVRPPADWQPVGPLVGHRRLGDAVARRPGRFRVLDLTRVIAGPVGTRFLAAAGGDVIRVDPPQLPEQPLQIADGLVGKRSTLVDARTADGLTALHRLLDGADVLVHGYRPGALARFGLDPDSLADRHPGLVVVALSAWGDEGPRAHQRGFDSIVQAASGIAVICSPGGDRPGALPCQLLDHGTGYLIAAAALDGLLRQRSGGGTQVRTLSLAATATWLMQLPRPENHAAPSVLDPSPWLTTIGRLTAVSPPGSLDGRPLTWPRGLPGYGSDAAKW